MPTPYRSRLLLPRDLPFKDAAERRWWYNYRGAGSDDLRSLTFALGGDSHVLGFYDARYNVTATTTASAWGDARGASGFGPQLAQATGTKQPAWDATAKTLTFDGTDDSLGSAASSLFNLSTDKSVIVVGAGTAGNLGRLAILINATSDRFLGVQLSSVGATYAPQYRDSAATYSANISTVATGATRRLIAAGKANTSLIADVPGKPQVTATPTGSCASENAALVVGDYRTSSAGSPCACVLRAVIVLDHKYTTAELSALSSWAVTYHGAVLA